MRFLVKTFLLLVMLMGSFIAGILFESRMHTKLSQTLERAERVISIVNGLQKVVDSRDYELYISDKGKKSSFFRD